MRDESEIYIDPRNGPRRNAANLEALRELRKTYAEMARYEANADVVLGMLDKVWTLDEVIEQGEQMTATLERETERAGHYVELFSGRFFEVRPDGWGLQPLRVYDLRRRSIARTFATPEAANGYAREQEDGAVVERRRVRATAVLAAAGLLVVSVLSAWRWL
jgi:hypothetical protein